MLHPQKRLDDVPHTSVDSTYTRTHTHPSWAPPTTTSTPLKPSLPPALDGALLPPRHQCPPVWVGEKPHQGFFMQGCHAVVEEGGTGGVPRVQFFILPPRIHELALG